MRLVEHLTRSDNARGIALIMCASFLSIVGSSLTKILAEDYPAIQISFVRGCVTVVCLFPFMAKDRFRGLWPARPKLMAFRSVNAAAIVAMNVYAVGNMPLVDFTAIGFTTPIFVILLSAIILRQTPRLDRSIVTLIGFVGVLMIVRPTGQVSLAMGAAVGGAFCLGLGVLLIRMLASSESQVRLLLWSNGALALFLMIPALKGWIAPEPVDWIIFVSASLVAASAQACILLGYERGEPMVIAPFDYSRILIAVGAGLLLFGEIPDIYTFFGILLVIGAGVFIARRKVPVAR